MSLAQRLRANVKFFETQKRKLGISFDTSKIDSITSPVEWVKATRKLHGQPFSFDTMHYLERILSDTSQTINIVKPRQMGVTEMILNWLFYNLIKNPGATGLYMTDRYEHVKIFSSKRVREAVEQSAYLSAVILKNKSSVSRLPFKNGSNLYMLSAWGDFEEARSIPADFAAVDEMQSVNVSALPVLTETMSRSKSRKIIKAGTGSDEGDAWWHEWHLGTQYQWDKNVMDSSGRQGNWIVTPNTISVPGISSYRIPWDLPALTTPEEIRYKEKAFHPRMFANEVQGWWYLGMKRPLTPADIQILLDRNLSFTPSSEVNDGWPIFMGIDLGGGTSAYTVAWIWQLINKDVPRFRVLNVTKMTEPSTERQADMLAELITKYKVHQIVSDAGGGARQVEKLSNRFKSRFFKCHYRYDANNPYELINSEMRVNVDRTWIIETIIDLIKRPEERPGYPHGIPRVQIPYAEPEKIEWMIDHFTCIEAEAATANGREYVRYIHGEETNDDALHAMCYSYVAYLIWKKNQFWYGSLT